VLKNNNRVDEGIVRFMKSDARAASFPYAAGWHGLEGVVATE
jgi:hypothetical protein